MSKIINYKSDFKLVECFRDSSLLKVPFRFTYYTKSIKYSYTVSYNGTDYINCNPTLDNRLMVIFDNHDLKIGQLKVKREFFLNDKDFQDGICYLISEECLDIFLDKNVMSECDEVTSKVQTYYHVLDIKTSSDLYYNNGTIGISDSFKSSKQDTILDLDTIRSNANKGATALQKVPSEYITESDVNTKIANLVDSAPEDLNTLNELAIALKNNKDVVEVLNQSITNKQDKLISGTNIKTINGESILGSGNISISGGGGETKLSGKLNLTSIDEIKSAQKALDKTNEIAFYLITDNTGKVPSTQSCYNIPSEAVRQLSLTSPDVTTNIVLNLLSVNMQPIGVNVGDFIALTRVKVKVSDLAASIGVSINLGGEIEIYQYKILSINDAKPAGHSEANAGVMGLMSPWDKGQVNKISGIEVTANNALPKKDVLPSRWANNMNDALQTGVYPWCDLGRPSGSTGHYTCIVNRTSTDDGSFNTIEQTAYGREAELGQVYKRIIFQHKDGNEIQFGEWINITSSGKSGTDEITSHCIILSDTNKVSVEHDLSTMSTIGVSIIAKDANSDVGYYCPSLYYNGSFFVFAFDYTYIVVKGPEGNFLVVEKQPTYSERFATKDEVATAIANAITNTLNTDV